MGGGSSHHEVNRRLQAQAHAIRLQQQREYEQKKLELEAQAERDREAARQHLEAEQKAETERLRLESEVTIAALKERQIVEVEEARKSFGEKMQERFTSSGASMRQASRDVLQISNTHTNLAVTGQSGAGKSALVNGLRQLSDKNDQKYAREGITETDRTHDFNRYEIPEMNIHLWDMAGSSQDHPGDRYFWDNHLLAFDYLLIVIKNSIAEVDMEIARNAAHCQIPYSFIRSKSDQEIDNELGDDTSLIDENGKQSLKQKVELDLLSKNSHLPEVESVRLFFVSSKVLKMPEKYDQLSIDEKSLLDHIRNLSR